MGILGRRGGITFTGTCLTLLAIYGGYSAWQDYTSPYRLTKADGVYYLINKDKNIKKEITKDFQLGSIDYRVKGLWNESKEKAKESLEKLAKELD